MTADRAGAADDEDPHPRNSATLKASWRPIEAPRGLGRAGLGAFLTVIGVVTLGPAVAGPVTAWLAAPIVRMRGVTGTLARDNATRNPRRTAASAAALMVGISVVTLFTVFAASFKSSITSGVSKTVHGDLVIATGSYGGGGLSPQLAAEISALPDVAHATGLGSGNALIVGKHATVSIIDAAQAAPLLNFDVASGSMATLTNHEIAVSKKTADARHWHLGDTVSTTFADGTTEKLAIAAIYRSRDLAGDYVIPQQLWAAHTTQSLDTAIFIAIRPGVPIATARAAVTTVAAAYGKPTVETRNAYVHAAGSAVNAALGLIYVLLALTIIIALLGIANTLSLPTHERARELRRIPRQRPAGPTRSAPRHPHRTRDPVTPRWSAPGLVASDNWILCCCPDRRQPWGEGVIRPSSVAASSILLRRAGRSPTLRAPSASASKRSMDASR
jgi:putative ABC transport system permease protein